MREPFSTKHEITKLEELHGRDHLINQLKALIYRNTTIFLRGVRRFGKTSTLQVLKNEIISDPRAKVFPVFIDIKETCASIKGTENVYRFFSARIISEMCKIGLLDSDFQFKNLTINPSDDWEDIYQALEDYPGMKQPRLFEDIVFFFSELLDKTIYLFIDEYEYLFRFAFDNPNGFMKLRNLSTRLNKNQLNPFNFLVCGSTAWDHLCSITGSGELNCIDQNISLQPLSRDDFQKMWDFEMEQSPHGDLGIKEKEQTFFTYSGGVPFYGKILASYYISNNTMPDQKALKYHFEEVLHNLPVDELESLNRIATKSKTVIRDSHILELLDKGLIDEDEGEFSIRSSLFNDFLVDKLNSKSEAMEDEAMVVCKKINEIFVTINDTAKSRINRFIFIPVNDDPSLFLSLQTPCYSKDVFSEFSGAIWKIFFEKTKGEHNGRLKNLQLLPEEYSNENEFLLIIDMMRHSLGKGHLMHNFKKTSKQISKTDMLIKLTGTKNDPYYPEEFRNLQITTLKLCYEELEKLLKIVRSL